MKNKFLSVVLAVCLLVTAVLAAQTNVFAVAVSGSCGSGVTWEYSESDHTLSISGAGELTDYSGFSAYADEIYTVTVGEGVTSLCDYAFSGYGNMTAVSLPAGLNTIGAFAFRSCSSLEAVEIPADVCSIGKSAFALCGALGAVTIPDGVTSIGENAFERCTGITSASIGNGVCSVPKYMFYECTGLKEIHFGSAVSALGDYAFYGCDSLEKITVDDNNTVYYDNSNCLITSETKRLELGCKASVIPFPVSSIGSFAFTAQSGLKSIYIPGFVTTIGNYSFKDCDGLETVTLDNGITKIGSYAFTGCKSLTALEIPATAADVGFPFTGCSSLEALTVGEGNTKYKSENNCIIDKATGALLMGCKNSTIPTYVTSIGESAFYGCTGLTSVVIPSNVKTVFNGAFAKCSGLTDVTITYGVGGINYCAFSECTALKSVTVPSSVSYISDYAFWKCDGLESITLPFVGYNLSGENGTFIGYIFGATAYSYNNYFLPQGLKRIEITNATSIAANAFRGCTGLTEIIIPDSVQTIGKGAFQGCSNLKSLTVPYGGASSSLTENAYFGYLFGAASYGKNADYVPSALTTVTLNRATGVAPYAFYGCKYLTEVTLSQRLTSVGANAFRGCSKLKKILFYDNVASVGANAFYSCSNLTITCQKGSTVEDYAKANSIKYTTYDYICELIGHASSSSATCSEPEVCDICGAVLKEPIEHAFITVETVEATEDADGYYITECSMCGQREYHTIKRKTDDGAVAPTIKKGDTDCDGYITENDLVILTRYLAGWKGYSIEVSAADINGDGRVTGRDRAILARYLASWEGYDGYFA